MESKGNPRLDTLELVAKGLKSELLLIPQEKLNAVLAVLADDTHSFSGSSSVAPTKPSQRSKEKSNSQADDPWQGLLGENE